MKPQTHIKTGHILLALLVAAFSFPQQELAKTNNTVVPESVQQTSSEQTIKPEVLGAFTDAFDPEPNSTDADAVLASEFGLKNDSGVDDGKVHPMPDFDAKALLAYQPDSGAILVAKNSDVRLPIASITKLMTALVAMDAPNFQNPITITANDQLNVSPSLKLKAGDTVLPIDLVKAMLVGSANDAAQALSNHFPNENIFVLMMNAKARELGMYNTSFSNPMGFDSENNFSTAADLSVLVKQAMKILPYEEVWQKNNYAFISEDGVAYKIQNSNNLVATHRNIKSIKTGLTPASLQSMITLAHDGADHKIVSIVLDSTNRNTQTLQLIDYVFKNFKLN